MLARPPRPRAPRGRGRAAAALGAVALALSGAGCDRDDEDPGPADRSKQHTEAAAEPAPAGTLPAPAERRAIRAALIRLFMEEDVRVACEETFTPRLFRLIYTAPASCRKAQNEEDHEDDEPLKRVDISDIRASGRTSSARVLLAGGDAAGATGLVELRKGNDGWRVDELSTPFLRSSVRASLRTDDDIPRPVRTCMEGRFTRIRDAEFRRFAYALVGQRPPARRRLLTTLSACDRGKGGVSVLRRSFEKDARKELAKAGADRKGAGCVLRRLRRTVPDRVMIELAASDDRRSKQRLTREVVAAAIACGLGRRPDPERLSPA